MVVGVRMGGDQQVDTLNALRLEVGGDRIPAAHVARVDQHILFGRLDELAVGLPHVDIVDGELPLRPRDRRGGKPGLFIEAAKPVHHVVRAGQRQAASERLVEKDQDEERRQHRKGAEQDLFQGQRPALFPVGPAHGCASSPVSSQYTSTESARLRHRSS